MFHAGGLKVRANKESSSEVLLKSTKLSNCIPESIEMNVIFFYKRSKQKPRTRKGHEMEDTKQGGTRSNFTFPSDPHGDRRDHLPSFRHGPEQAPMVQRLIVYSEGCSKVHRLMKR